MLEVRHLAFSYPGSQFSVEIEHLSLAAGESVALVGPSGCGKTTFLELIAGIRQMKSGSIQIDGVDLSDITNLESFRLNSIGLVFQEFELIPYLTVRENIELPYLIGGERQESGRANALAERLEITHLLKRLPRRISQGERQRVAISRALMAQPKLILADEPTGNLDPLRKKEVLSLLLEQSKQEKCAVIVVTHDSDVLEEFDRVITFADLSGKEAV